MQHSLATFVALAISCFFGIARSYHIHADCGGDTDFIRKMIEEAFSMANAVSAAVKTIPNTPGVDFLGGQLFGFQGDQLKGIVESAFDPHPVNTRGFTPGILSIQQEQTGALNTLGFSEVVFFCTTSRLSPHVPPPPPPGTAPPGPQMFDSVAQRAINGKGDGCNSAFMWTYVFAAHWDMVQICPWFIEYAKAKKYKTSEDVKSFLATLALQGLDELITGVAFTPIDLLSLWDKSVLHELMHTKVGGEMQDEKPPWLKSYGWKNCKAMVTNGGATRNPDSFALLGSALWSAIKGSPVDADGKFTNKPVFNQLKRWIGSGAGMAMDVIKSEVVKPFT